MRTDAAPQALPASPFDLVSRAGRRYRIFIFCPPEPAPPAGYPILYLLDGNASFATAADAMAMQMRRTEVTGVPPAIVVGIGYPTTIPINMEQRQRDYTPPASAPEEATGGAETFIGFIEQELKPLLAAALPIDRRRQALFGHSLGGLFTLWTLFNHPRSFQSYIAASPSIWWNGRCVLADERRFVATTNVPAPGVRLLVTVGSLETVEGPPQQVSGQGGTMIDEAAGLVARLNGAGNTGLHAQFVKFDDENHASVVPAAVSRSLRFAWPI